MGLPVPALNTQATGAEREVTGYKAHQWPTPRTKPRPSLGQYSQPELTPPLQNSLGEPGSCLDFPSRRRQGNTWGRRVGPAKDSNGRMMRTNSCLSLVMQLGAKILNTLRQHISLPPNELCVQSRPCLGPGSQAAPFHPTLGRCPLDTRSLGPAVPDPQLVTQC